MQRHDGPTVTFTTEDAWRIRRQRGDRQLLAVLEDMARQYEAEAGWRSTLRPACEVARQLEITEHALRGRLRRGTWPGQVVERRWWAVPPGSELAPPCRP